MRGIGKNMAALWRRWLVDRSGSIAVEGAFAIILLLAMLLPLIDFGGYIGTKLELKQGLRAGGQYALDDYTDTTTIETVIKNAASLSSGSVTVTFQTPATYCLCNDGSAGTCIGDPGFQVCSFDSVPAGRYMTIQASATYDPLFPFLAWFQSNMTVTEQLTLRVQ